MYIWKLIKWIVYVINVKKKNENKEKSNEYNVLLGCLIV